jgi:hypothetical protein
MAGQGHFLKAVVPRQVDVPDGQSLVGQTGVAADFSPAFNIKGLVGIGGIHVAEAGNGISRVGEDRPLGRRVQAGDRFPTRVMPKRGIGRHGILAIGAAAGHEAVVPCAPGVAVVIVEVGPTEEHVSVLMAEGSDRKGGPDVGDLIVPRPHAVSVEGGREGTLVGPKALAPSVVGLPSVKGVDGPDAVAGIDAQASEIETRGLQGSQGLVDQFLGPGRIGNSGVGVIGLVVQGRVISRDDVGVVQIVVGDRQKIIADGAVVTEPGIT